MSAEVNDQVSFNFAVAKVVAILLVVAGHYFNGSLLWVPVTVGLFVFAYSSAFFTSRKYGSKSAPGQYWGNKIKRLMIPLWVIQGFLLAVFIVTARDGIWTWQTALHWLGLSGWLNWLNLANPSPFGAGMWFFTLLLIFYLLHSAIAYFQEVPGRARWSLVVVLLLTLVLQKTHHVGHALWLTAFGFWFGSYVAINPVGGSARSWLLVAIGGAVLMVGLSLGGIKSLNPYLMYGICISTVLWLGHASLPRRPPLTWLLWLTPCTLPIYLIHTYLFVGEGLPIGVAFAVSLLLTLACACLLARMSSRLEHILYAHPAHP